MTNKVALVSMPWRLPHIPPVGLALLKAAIARECDVSVDILHLDISWFHFLEEESRLMERVKSRRFIDLARATGKMAGVLQSGEWMFARAFFHDAIPSSDMYRVLFENATRERFDTTLARDFIACAELVPQYLEVCLRKIDWQNYAVVGFSCVFYQLNASLALAHLLRSNGFSGRIVFGGPLCEGVVGKQLLRLFPFIDAVFDGEADLSLPKYIAAGEERAAGGIPGVWTRAKTGAPYKIPGDMSVRDMDFLPRPDYGDYFSAAAAVGLSSEDILFPIEASRGCWWGERHHCIFCGLNGSDMRHRTKSSERIIDEIRDAYLTRDLRRFAFTDNILSPNVVKSLLPRIENDAFPITFEAEVKSNLSRRQIQAYRRAGFVTLQLGIESLSTRVLRIMKKGVSATANIAALKWCAEAGVTAIWNLLYGFPGERKEDFDAIAKLLPSIVHLRAPMLVTPMSVARFSPSFSDSLALGFNGCRPAAFYRLMYPYDDNTLKDLVQYFDFDFDDCVDRQSAIQPINEFVDFWKRLREPGTLVYDAEGAIDGQAALFDSRANATLSYRELDPLENYIFQLCDKPCTLADLIRAVDASKHRTAGESIISDVLQSFIAHRFVIEDEGTFLNVAMSNCTFLPWTAIATLDSCDSLKSVEQTITLSQPTTN